MYKLRSEVIEPRWMIGVDPSPRAWPGRRELGLEATHEGVDWLLKQDELPDLIFEATSAYVHREYAPRYAEAGIRAIDLTPAAVGPGGDPAGQPARAPRRAERQHDHLRRPGHDPDGRRGLAGVVDGVVRRDRRLGLLGLGRAGHPRQHRRVHPHHRQGVETIGGAERGKAIIILNPAEPPMIMRDTIFCAVAPRRRPRRDRQSIQDVVDEVQTYVPGYRLLQEPQFDDPSRRGGSGVVRPSSRWRAPGDYLPPYAGNLDIMTAAAAQGRRGDRPSSRCRGAEERGMSTDIF